MNDWLERQRGHLLVLLLSFTAMAGFVFLDRRPTRGAVEILPPPTATPAPTSTPVVMKVHVSGAVETPDVYVLPAGSRVERAVEAAGGLSDDAVEAGINLAQPLIDGQQIYVPHEGETSEPIEVVRGSPVSALSSGGALDINVASTDDLEALPGIGPAIAGRIVAYRDENGPFRTIQDIKQVKGIGDATFEKLKDQITVR